MGRIHIAQSPLTQIITNINRVRFDKYFRLYFIIWVFLLGLVGGFAYHSILKSLDSYENPDRQITLKYVDQIEFPPLVFCASNTDVSDLSPKTCSFHPRGPNRDPKFECDWVKVDLTLNVFEFPLVHRCGILRGVQKPQLQPQDDQQQLLQTKQDGQQQDGQQQDGQQQDGQQQQQDGQQQQQQEDRPNVLAGRTIANATYPSSQFTVSFENNTNVYFHAILQKTITSSESESHRYIPDPSDPNPIYVPRGIDGWIKLYSGRVESVVLKLSTMTYIDETVVFRYDTNLRPLPCEGECASTIQSELRFDALEVEDAQEVVTFDWLYVVGATGGALTVAEIVFMVIHPIAQRIVFGKRQEGEEETEAGDGDDAKDPLISKEY